LLTYVYEFASAKYDGNDDEHPNMSGLLIALHEITFSKMKLKKQPRTGLFLFFEKTYSTPLVFEASILGVKLICT
jgi:hypothetical protein